MIRTQLLLLPGQVFRAPQWKVGSRVTKAQLYGTQYLARVCCSFPRVCFLLAPAENAPRASPPSAIGRITALTIKITSASVLFSCRCCRFSTGRKRSSSVVESICRPENNPQTTATRSSRVPDATGAGPSAEVAWATRKPAASFWFQQKASHWPWHCELSTAAGYMPAGQRFTPGPLTKHF